MDLTEISNKYNIVFNKHDKSLETILTKIYTIISICVRIFYSLRVK